MKAETTVLNSPGFRTGLDACIRCGLCLPSCPTYEVSRAEMEGPRGRIALMRAAADGRIGVGGAFREHIDSCLGCRSCETACPSGVHYGALLEQAREAIEADRPKSRFERFARWLCLHQLLPRRGRLRALARWVRIARTTGLIRLAQTTFAPAWLRRGVALLPPSDGERLDRGKRGAATTGNSRGRVALFRGCVQDAFLPSVNAATIRVLERNGYDVDVVDGETCCGAAALHLGERELARDLARRNLEAFDPDRYDAIVSNAGGCGAMLREYPRLLGPGALGLGAGGAGWGPKAERFAGKIRDVSEFLEDHLHVVPEVAVPRRVTYVDSCHLRHAQKVASAPRELLRQIPGLELIEQPRPDFCCGSAGVYNLIRPEDADRVLDLKMKDVGATDAELIVTTNPGCQLQLAAGVRRTGLKARVVHLVELLDQAYAS